MNTRDSLYKKGIIKSLIGTRRSREKSKTKRTTPDIKTEHIMKCVINDEKTIKQINLNRDFLEAGIVKEGLIVLFRIFIPMGSIQGVIDMQLPLGEDNSLGFRDWLEAHIEQDFDRAYRLFPRNRRRDIPKDFYAIIENNLLIPISTGSVVPYKGHVYGKGVIYQIAHLPTKTNRLSLEEVEIISPQTHISYEGIEISELLPDYYEKAEGHISDVPDYEAIIKEGENDRVEFKSSARWDYKQTNVNKEIEKSILKTIAGFLNSAGGTLFIGVDDDGKVLGLKEDIKTLRKRNYDGYRLFLSDLISHNIGKEYNAYSDIIFKEIGGNTICIVEIKRSKRQAFVKDGDDVRFFVRTQNSTRELNVKEAHEYISSHWISS